MDSGFSGTVDSSLLTKALADSNHEKEHLIEELWKVILELKGQKSRLSLDRDVLRTLIDAMPDFIYVKDREHRFILNNKAHLKLLGVEDSSLTAGKTDFDFFPQEHAARYFEDDAIVLNYGTPIIDREELNIDRHGREIWVSTTKVALRNDDGKVVGIIGMSRDISHRKHAREERQRLEEEVNQHQKLEILGQLAGGIVHDFNNIIMAIQGHASILKHQLGETDPELAKTAATIGKASESAAALTRKLLAFVKKEAPQKGPVDLHDLIDGIMSLLQSTFDKNIELSMDLCASAFIIEAEKSTIENALLNLAVNARDAMPQGGRLTFKTLNVAMGEKESPIVNVNLTPGNYIAVSITDTGTGMDDATRKRIFEPFFTTKAKGKGTGLGLPSVYLASKKHNGAIDVITAPSRGTTFTLYFPLSIPEAEELDTKIIRLMARNS